MKRFWNIMFILLLPCAACSQGSNFNKTFDFRHTVDSFYSELGESIVEIDNRYYLINKGLKKYNGKLILLIQLLKLNNKGEIIDQKTFQKNYHLDPVRIHTSLIEDGRFLLSGTAYDSIAHPFTAIVDTSLNITSYKTYPDWNNVQYIRDGRKTPDGGFIFTGYQSPVPLTGAVYPFFMKLDSNRNVEWKKAVNSITAADMYCVEIAPDGGYVAGGLSQKSHQQRDAFILKIDSLGGYQWQYKYNSTMISSPLNNILVDSNGYNVIINDGVSLYDNAFYNADIRILQLDLSGQVNKNEQIVLEKLAQYTWAFKKVPGGGFILGGLTYLDTLYRCASYLLKLDDSFNIEWRRWYQSPGHWETDEHYLSDIKVTEDGGYAFSGFIIPQPFGGRPWHTQDAWVVKTDSLGCVWEGCESETEWFPIGAKWHYAPNGSPGNLFGVCNDGYSTMEVVGDTLLLGQTTKKVKVRSFGKDMVKQRREYFYSEHDKVYHFDKTRDSFYVLYDFNLKAGDTLIVRRDTFKNYSTQTGPGYTDYTMVIDSVETITIDGKELRVQYTHNPSQISIAQKWGANNIIETIGSDGSSFFGSAANGYAGAGCWGNFRCYEDSAIFLNVSTMVCDELVTGIRETSTGTLQVFPNPSSGRYHFQMELPASSTVELEIFNLSTGQLIESTRLKGQLNLITEMDLSGQPAGVYLYVVRVEGVIFDRGKLVLLK